MKILNDILMIDDFLGPRTFKYARELSKQREYFSDVENPIDEINYKNIRHFDAKHEIYGHVLNRLDTIYDNSVQVRYMFMRASPAGTIAPNQVHNDISMGQKSLMIYLNDLEQCQGGTSFLDFIGDYGDSEEDPRSSIEIYRENANSPNAWRTWKTCEMHPNRACIFNAELMHRAEPVGGFGTTPEDWRVVLTCFFDIE